MASLFIGAAATILLFAGIFALWLILKTITSILKDIPSLFKKETWID